VCAPEPLTPNAMTDDIDAVRALLTKAAD